MQLKMINVVNASSLYSKIKDQVLPIKLNYKFNKLFTKINAETEFYQTEFQKILTKYAEIDDEGNFVTLESNDGVKLKEGCAADAQNELSDLWDLEVELPDIKFSLDELETISFTMNEFNYLLPFIEE